MIEFVVWGRPVSQGSMKAVPNKRGGKPILKPSNESQLKAWRRAITRAARMTGRSSLSSAVRMTVTFWLKRGKTVKRELPTVQPDYDKLVRAVGDSLTGVLFDDDAQITTAVIMKRYTDDRDCAVIRIEEDVAMR